MKIYNKTEACREKQPQTSSARLQWFINECRRVNLRGLDSDGSLVNVALSINIVRSMMSYTPNHKE